MVDSNLGRLTWSQSTQFQYIVVVFTLDLNCANLKLLSQSSHSTLQIIRPHVVVFATYTYVVSCYPWCDSGSFV